MVHVSRSGAKRAKLCVDDMHLFGRRLSHARAEILDLASSRACQGICFTLSNSIEVSLVWRIVLQFFVFAKIHRRASSVEFSAPGGVSTAPG